MTRNGRSGLIEPMKAEQIPLIFQKPNRRSVPVRASRQESPEKKRSDPSSLPRFRDMDDVKRYLREHTKLHVTDGRSDPKMQALRLEEILTQDIETAKEQGAKPETIDELRKLIFAMSWKTHEGPQGGQLLEHITRLETEVRNQASELGGRGSSPDDVREYLAEYLPCIEAIRRTILTDACGEEATTGLQAIEIFMNQAWQQMQDARPSSDRAREKALQNLQNLRPIRDQIYYQSVYAPWCETASPETH